MIKPFITVGTHKGREVYLKSSGAVRQALATAYAEVRSIDERTLNGLASAVAELADQMTAYAKANHGWKNRTRAAEEGLHPVFVERARAIFGGVAHGEDIDYAIWLESRPDLAIIQKTQEVFASKAAGLVAREIGLELRGRGSKFRDVSTGRFV